MTLQFFQAIGTQAHFFLKTDAPFEIIMLIGSMCTKFQVYIVFYLVRGLTITSTQLMNNYKGKYRKPYPCCAPPMDLTS